MFTSLHHSREPLTITMVMLMVIEILKSFTRPKHGFAKELLRDNIVFFIPTLNTDSYKYITDKYKRGEATEEVLMIRKNRNIDLSCNSNTGGVDLNRNYDFKFALDESGSSSDPCAEDYRGEKPFSEKETQAVKKFVDDHKNIVSCVNIHTYGNAWIYPYNYIHDGNNHLLESKQPLIFNFYKEFENKMIEKGQRAHFGNSAFVLDYPTNGEAGDWFTGAKNILNIDVELGDDSKPSEQFYPPREIHARIVRYNWIIMKQYLTSHIVDFHLNSLTIRRGFPPKMVFEIFNTSISSLTNAAIEIKPVFRQNKPFRYLINYAIKADVREKKIRKTVRSHGQIRETIKGRHILEIELLLNSENDIRQVASLEMVIRRSERNYLNYPDQKYVFTTRHKKSK